MNKDLADVLGNFVNRVTKFCVARFDGKVPGEGAYGEDEKALIAELDRRVAQYTEHLEAMEFRKALGELRAIWVAGKRIHHARRALDALSRRIAPRLPSACAWDSTSCICSGICRGRSFRRRHAPSITRSWPRREIIPWPDEADGGISRRARARAADPSARVLFAKITDEQIAEWEARFGGTGAA